jgi:hypothetical protein
MLHAIKRKEKGVAHVFTFVGGKALSATKRDIRCEN